MTISTIIIGGINYISYASLIEANNYLAVDPVRSAAWALLTDDQKGANLIAATRRLDLLKWRGAKTGGAAQANEWPRTGVTYKDGTVVPDNVVPQEVEDATALLAGSITLSASNAEAGSSASNVKSVKAGSASVEFFRPTTGGPLQDRTSFDLISCFLTSAATSSAGLGQLASGTDQSSSFTDPNYPDLTEGFA